MVLKVAIGFRSCVGRCNERSKNCRKAQSRIRKSALSRIWPRHCSHTIIHLIYQSKFYEEQSKDYEFGLSAMRAHWQSGLEGIRRTLADPHRLDAPLRDIGIVTHDIHRRD